MTQTAVLERQPLTLSPSRNSPKPPSTRCERPRGWYHLLCIHGSQAWKPLRCKHCPGCQRWKAKKHAAQLMTVAHLAVNPAFLTLTTTPTATWPATMAAFSKFIKTLRRRNPDLAYAAVKEQGFATGMKHLHVLLVNWRYEPQKLLSELWEKYTGAHHVNIQAVPSSAVYGYVAKYSTKATADTAKTITFSRNWPRLPWTPPETFITKFFEPPTPRPWIKELPDGTLIEVLAPNCTCFDHPPLPPPRPDIHLN